MSAKFPSWGGEGMTIWPTVYMNVMKNVCKDNCVLSSYSVPTVLYTEVLKRNIQYFAIIRVFIVSQE